VAPAIKRETITRFIKKEPERSAHLCWEQISLGKSFYDNDWRFFNDVVDRRKRQGPLGFFPLKRKSNRNENARCRLRYALCGESASWEQTLLNHFEVGSWKRGFANGSGLSRAITKPGGAHSLAFLKGGLNITKRCCARVQTT
jgi:hypothetical protein